MMHGRVNAHGAYHGFIFNPFTPKSDEFKFFPAASPEI